MGVTIDNTEESSVTGQWSNPGAPLYDRLLAEPNYKALIKEAYLIAPVAKIQKDVKDPTSFSASGVGYPHHVIRDGKLVVHRRGLIASYSRAQQQGIFDGEVEAHLIKHYKELGLYKESTMEEDELKHFGILGMKWGVRRATDSAGIVVKSKEHLQTQQLKKKSSKELTTAELSQAVNRMRLEKQYNELNPSGISSGKKTANRILGRIGNRVLDRIIDKNIDAVGSKVSKAAEKAAWEYSTRKLGK